MIATFAAKFSNARLQQKYHSTLPDKNFEMVQHGDAGCCPILPGQWNGNA